MYCLKILIVSAGFGNDDAYSVAQMIHKMRVSEGAVPVGRKIGFTNPEMWSVYGVHEPVWSYMYDRSVARLSNPEAQCRIDHFAEPKIEPEIVVHFRARYVAKALRATIDDLFIFIDEESDEK